MGCPLFTGCLYCAGLLFTVLTVLLPLAANTALIWLCLEHQTTNIRQQQKQPSVVTATIFQILLQLAAHTAFIWLSLGIQTSNIRQQQK
jgi:hypothetical protein